jgi:hypothetical protein
MATITALAGIEPDPGRPLDGINLIPYLTGKEKGAPHDHLFWRKWESNAMAIRSGSDKLVSNGKRDTDNYELFNLEQDIGEKNDRRSQQPETAESLLKEWEAWNAQLKNRIFPSLGEDKWWKR